MKRQTNPTHKVDIKPIKKWADANLHQQPKLRTLILSEKDEVSVEAYIALIGAWTRLLRLETS